jgi:hypothetical protein
MFTVKFAPTEFLTIFEIVSNHRSACKTPDNAIDCAYHSLLTPLMDSLRKAGDSEAINEFNAWKKIQDEKIEKIERSKSNPSPNLDAVGTAAITLESSAAKLRSSVKDNSHESHTKLQYAIWLEELIAYRKTSLK